MRQLKFLLTLLPLLLLFSCRERTLELQMAPHEPKIVILANWKAGDTLSVRLLRSLDPFGKVPEDIALPNPLIKLLKDGQPVAAQFTNLGDGLYRSNVLVEPSHTYQVLVEHVQYPAAASQPMLIPAIDASEIVVKRSKNVQGSPSSANQDQYEIDISRVPLSASYCYTISFLISFEDETRTFSYSWPAPDVSALQDAACSAEDRVQQTDKNSHYWLVSADCLSSSKEKLKFYVDTTVEEFDGGKWDSIKAEKVQLKVGIANAEWLAFAQVNNMQPEGRDQLVMSPKLYKSNITNGYGMVTTLSEVTFEYED